jgi:tRNA threonylcarbamoyladenosine biosynthesis protein TsaE
MNSSFKKRLLTEQDTLVLGTQLALAIEEGAIIFLYGPLGAGKTTLTRGFLRGLGYQDKVKSPTYTLVEPYEVASRHVFHFDLYRLHDHKELEHIGIHEYFFPAAICLIEWPENGGEILPKPDISCYIAFADKERKIRIEASSSRGEIILQRLQKDR